MSSHEQDLVWMKHAIGGAQRFAAAPVWSDYILELSTDISDLEDSIRNQVRPAGHSVGIASVSLPNAHWGVVDPDLRFKQARGERSEGCGRVGLPYVLAAGGFHHANELLASPVNANRA
ncbi:uncharacterized protein ARMOST_22114 [Armillaria ostoyae]|uniref:Uncharacterized protein n=1 Tax=Armillaria ostoyae TaxID=47428 RepID=A0A284SBZ4_ARMOS|nr:uncharacterized protein ARMOST_22114 [Armillaria ostoyae]